MYLYSFSIFLFLDSQDQQYCYEVSKVKFILFVACGNYVFKHSSLIGSLLPPKSSVDDQNNENNGEKREKNVLLPQLEMNYNDIYEAFGEAVIPFIDSPISYSSFMI